MRFFPFTGDEPHYVMTTISLVRDHDFNLANNYRNHDLAAFGWHALEPQIGNINDPYVPPPHGTGFAMLTALPYAVFGLNGIRYFLILIALTTCFLTAALCDRLGFHALAGTAAGFLLATSPTWQMYASRMLPECLTGFVAVAALWLAHEAAAMAGRGYVLRFLAGVAAILPATIYLKYTPITIGLLTYCLATKQLRRSLPFYAGLACAGAIGMAITLTVYGPHPITGSGATNTPFQLNGLFSRLTANWFDKGHGVIPYQPAFILALWAIPSFLSMRRDTPAKWVLFSSSVAVTGYFLMYALFAGSPAESMPGRYACASLPLMAMLVPAWVFTRRVKRPAEDSLVALALFGLAYTFACAYHDAPPWAVLDYYRGLFSHYWGPASFTGSAGVNPNLGAAAALGVAVVCLVALSKASVVLFARFPVSGLLPDAQSLALPTVSLTPPAASLPPWTKARTICAALILFGSFRIAATYTVFNHTFDEQGHLAAGMELLDKHIYGIDHQHPPLARLLGAGGLYLIGIRSHNDFSRWVYSEGNALLKTGGHYDRNLAIARLGELPLFWLACFVVYYWAKQSYSQAAGLLALGIFSFIPAILAHAGLITTDMALCAGLSFACFAWCRWVQAPSAGSAAVFGLAGGIAILSKLSALVYFPAAVVIATVWELFRRRPSRGALVSGLRHTAILLAVAIPVAALAIWTGYRFSFGLVRWWNIRLPAPELFAGIKVLLDHQEAGHHTYLFGRQMESGWWLYYPSVLAMKTPPAFLVLFVIALIVCVKNWKQLESSIRFPLSLFLGVLAVGAASRINIGVRHILPVYVGMSIVTAIAMVHILTSSQTHRWFKRSVICLLVLFGIDSLASHPDYLAYTTPFIGGQPERYIAESDLDWGQDVKRLATRSRQLGINEITFSPYLYGGVSDVPGMPATKPSVPEAPMPGWNAVSVSEWKVRRMGATGSAVPWPDRVGVKPVERIGKTILLWHFDAGGNGAAK